jgi:hypothetical protein
MIRAWLLLVCCCTSTAFAQSFYIKPVVSHLFPLSMGHKVMLDGYPYTGTGLSQPGKFVYNNDKASLAAGTYLGLAAGVFINEQLALELSVTHGLSTKVYTIEADINANPYSGLPPTYHTSISQYMDKPLLLTPSIVWNQDPSIRGLYVRIGAVIPLSRAIYSETRSQRDSSTFFDKREYKTRFALGFSGTLGYRVPINHFIAVLAEANLQLMSFKVDEARLLVSQANGEDIMPSRSQSQKLVYYVDNYAPSSGSPDEPGRMPAYRIPFSGYGFSLGLEFQLN